jgi:hypothetical protein
LPSAQGAILGFDLAGMIRNFDASFRGEGARTVYDSITANFVISDGVRAERRPAARRALGWRRGRGSVDLGRGRWTTASSRASCVTRTGEAGIAVPILVSRGRGPTSASVPDLEYLAEQEFLEQRDRLADEAEARLAEEQDRMEQDVRDRANDLLGTDIEAGRRTREEIEDALHRPPVGGDAERAIAHPGRCRESCRRGGKRMIFRSFFWLLMFVSALAACGGGRQDAEVADRARAPATEALSRGNAPDAEP